MAPVLTYDDITEAADRIRGEIRPVVVAPADGMSPGVAPGTDDAVRAHLALEFLQHTGSFKARGALNFLTAHTDADTVPRAGVTIASGGNAGLACAWAARKRRVPATVFVPTTAPAVKVERLRSYGARVEVVGSQYADAAAACAEFAAGSGALLSHAYDHPLIAAGAGTLVDEIRARIPDLTRIVVAVGGGGLFAGVATAAHHHGIGTVAVEPEHCRALNAAVEAGKPVDVEVDSVAADSLGARRTSAPALAAAGLPGVDSLLVPDELIIRARQALWDERRLAVELGAATALAALLDPVHRHVDPDERVCVILCGANTDPSDLVTARGAGPRSSQRRR